MAILVKMLPYHYLAIKTTPGANHIKLFTAYPSEAPEKCSIQGRPLGLPANIRLGCKGLPGTSTSLLLKSVNYAVKRFIGLASGTDLINFGVNLLTHLESYIFSQDRKVMVTKIKLPILHKSVSKCTQNPQA